MTEAPIWPGVAENLYQAASLASVESDGTWMMPSALTPRCSSSEFTSMAGMSTDTGRERGSDGPRALPPPGPVAPAAARAGCCACAWALITKPTAATPPMTRRTPTIPATRARRLPGLLGGGREPFCGQETTTRNPAMRRHPASPNAVVPPAIFPRGCYSRSLMINAEQAVACMCRQWALPYGPRRLRGPVLRLPDAWGGSMNMRTAMARARLSGILTAVGFGILTLLVSAAVSACTTSSSTATLPSSSPSHSDSATPTASPSATRTTVTPSTSASHSASPSASPSATRSTSASPLPTAAPPTGGGGTAGFQDVALLGLGGAAILAGAGSLAYRRKIIRNR